MCRSLPTCVLVTCPNSGLPCVYSPLLLPMKNCGVFATLKLSARNSITQRSVKGKFLNTDKSTLRVGGSTSVCSPRLPCDNGAGGPKIAVLNHSLGVRPPGGASFGFTACRSCGEQPLSFPDSIWHPFAVSVNGWPVWNVRMLLTCQLPTITSTTRFRFAPYCLPRPNGIA